MAKARRMLDEQAALVDIICELSDARIPRSSRNPELDAVAAKKPRLLILNRVDLADPQVTAEWVRDLKARGTALIEVDARSGRGVANFPKAVREVLKDKLAKEAERGQTKPIRAMIVGIPNVGKSTFINKAAKRKAAIASDRPGVTRGRQWINVDAGLDLLDTPGLLWPKLTSETLANHLAFTGAINDDILDIEDIAAKLLVEIAAKYPQLLTARYKIEDFTHEPHELLETAAKKRGFLRSGGVPDTERMSRILLDEFRGGVIGRITLEQLTVDN
jgi:ribosome biogenesis GTPase A